MIEIAEIKASIQSKSLIQDEFFKDAIFLKDSRGRFISYTGGYTVVIPCCVNSEKWAFRCWHLQVDDSKKRYTLIGETLQNENLPYFCSFEYIENGLIVKGKSFPITKMKWVEGDNLKKYICKHCRNKNKILKLAKSFAEMISVLHRHKIAHGDLQHGNILVSESDQLFLVDYDSMYVPSMGETFRDVITGLIDYQHPARKNNQYLSEKLDYFSELIIYTSLLGIAEKPDFVQSYKVEDTEGLLFSASDFSSIQNSKIYRELSELHNTEIDKCLEILLEYLSKDDINELKPFESYLMSIEISAPEFIADGDSCEIQWISNGAESIQIEDIGEVSLSGKIRVNPTAAKNYTFILRSSSGNIERKIIKIEVYKRGKINLFQAERAYTFNTIPINISWDCVDMNYVEIVGYGRQASKGSLEVEIKKDTTFELYAKDHFTEFTRKITVNVLPLPSIKCLRVPKFEAEYTSNVSISPSRIIVRSLGTKINVNNSIYVSNSPMHISLGKKSIYPPRVVITKGIMEFTDRTAKILNSLFRFTHLNITNLVNYITKSNK